MIQVTTSHYLTSFKVSNSVLLLNDVVTIISVNDVLTVVTLEDNFCIGKQQGFLKGKKGR